MNLTIRNPYFDFLKGIAVFMVVSIHTFSIFFDYENMSFFALCLRQIMNVAVPLFCVSSAYFLIEKDLSNGNYFQFLKKQIMRVYIPCLFFSLQYFVLDIKNGCNVLKSIIKFITCSYSVYYFVALIIQFYIFLPLFQKTKVFKNRVFGFVVTFVWVSLYTYFIKPKIDLPLIIYGGCICCFFVYFSLGASINKDKNLTKKWILVFISIFAFALMLFESKNLMYQSKTLVGSGLKPSCILFCIPLLILLFSKNLSEKYKSRQCFNFFETVGQFSLGIYLSHMYVIFFLEKFLFNKISIHCYRGGAVDFSFCINSRFLLHTTLCCKTNLSAPSKTFIRSIAA